MADLTLNVRFIPLDLGFEAKMGDVAIVNASANQIREAMAASLTPFGDPIVTEKAARGAARGASIGSCWEHLQRSGMEVALNTAREQVGKKTAQLVGDLALGATLSERMPAQETTARLQAAALVEAYWTREISLYDSVFKKPAT